MVEESVPPQQCLSPYLYYSTATTATTVLQLIPSEQTYRCQVTGHAAAGKAWSDLILGLSTQLSLGTKHEEGLLTTLRPFGQVEGRYLKERAVISGPH